MSDKVIVGRIGNKSHSEAIGLYQMKIPEQVATAKKNIRRWFEEQGFNGDDVVFDD